MTRVFNKLRDRKKRKELRHAIPESEIILWSRLKGKQLAGEKFRRQFGIGRYVVDFYCADARLVVEIDGDSHFTNEAEAYDRIRDDYLRSLGLRVVRFTNRDIRTKLILVLDTIAQEIILSKEGWEKRSGKISSQ